MSMSKLVVFLVIIIFVSIAAVIFFNKNSTSQPDSLNLSISPTSDQSVSQTVPSPTGSVSATLNPVAPDASSSGTQTTATKAVIKTSRGTIELQLYPSDAPKTVANFARKAQNNFYTNLTFHRVEDWVIQGGDPLGNGTGGGTMQTELNNKPFVTGSLGVARGGNINISNDAQFFITKKDSNFLNGQYTNFGIVTKGMDVVNTIQIGDKIISITTE